MKRNIRMPRSTLAIAVSMIAGVALAQQVAPRTTTITSTPTAPVVGVKPIIATVDITGTPSGTGGVFAVGDTLTATYTQTDADLDAADEAATKATIKWYANGVQIGTGETYRLTAAERGKVITFRIVPHTSATETDPYQGDESDSSTVSGVEGEGIVTIPGTADTDATAVAVTGQALVGQTLTATPSCPGTCDPTITYQWQIETAQGANTYTNISGETSSTYVVKRDEQLRKIRVIAVNPGAVAP